MKSQLLLSLQENGFLMCTRILALVTILCKNPKGRRTFFYFDLSYTFMEVLSTIYLKNLLCLRNCTDYDMNEEQDSKESFLAQPAAYFCICICIMKIESLPDLKSRRKSQGTKPR